MTERGNPEELEELVADATGAVDGSETGKGLRAQLEAANTELKAYKDRSLDEAFTKNGLSRDAGMGKAIAQIYDGEPTPEALSTFLIEGYGYEYQGEDHPMAATMGVEQSKLDAVSDHAGSIAPPTHTDRLAAAESHGDYQETLQMKGEQMAKWFRGPQ